MNDNKESPRKLTRMSAFVAMLCSLPVLLLFAYFDKFYLGIGASICSSIVLLVIRKRWDLRKHLWFWIAVIFITILQVPIILLIPWHDSDLTAFTLLPVGLLDYYTLYGSIKFLEWAMKRD